MDKKFLIVYLDDSDCAQGVFNAITGELVHVIDVIHGNSWQNALSLCTDFEIDCDVKDTESLLGRTLNEEEEDSLDMLQSDEIFALEEIKQKILANNLK